MQARLPIAKEFFWLGSSIALISWSNITTKRYCNVLEKPKFYAFPSDVVNVALN